MTIVELAEDKALPEEFLREQGLRDTAEGVAISYKDLEGTVSHEKTRTALAAKDLEHS